MSQYPDDPGMTRLTAKEKVEIVTAFREGMETCLLAHTWELTTVQVEALIRQAMCGQHRAVLRLVRRQTILAGGMLDRGVLIEALKEGTR